MSVPDVAALARLREPGFEYMATLETEMSAAVAGGVTSLACPPDTDPALDEPGLVDMLKFRARKLSLCRLFPLGALTRGLAGEALTEMVELTESGCVGFSQAETPIRDTQVLLRAAPSAQAEVKGRLAINRVVPLLTRQIGEEDPRTGEGAE